MLSLNGADGLDLVCRQITVGRTLARKLTAALRDHTLSETEFRVLWLIRQDTDSRLKLVPQQSSMSKQLGISPAQVSAVVEKLRAQGVIVSSESPSDRRRRRWRFTPTGQQRFDAVHELLNDLSYEWLAFCREMTCPQSRGDAA